MKLAYIVAVFPCIRETFILREVEYFRSNNYELEVFAYKKDIAQVTKDTEEWVKNTQYFKKYYINNVLAAGYYLFAKPGRVYRVLRLWLKETGLLSIRQNLELLQHILTAFGVAREISKQNIDRMHAHFSTASTIALITNILTDVPFSFTAHASGDIYIYSPLLFDKIRSAKDLITISGYNKRYLQSICNYEIDMEKIHIVTNGVEVPEKIDDKRSNDIPVIVMSAGFVSFKGHGTLIKALDILVKQGDDFVCYLIGDGPLLNTISKLTNQYGLSDRVKFPGSQPLSEVVNYLKMADIFVFPAEVGINGARDGMPTAITEALSYGLPIVSTPVSGITDQVNDGVNGYLVAERNECSLANKLSVLINDKKLRIEMGRASYNLALEKFQLNDNIKKLASILYNENSDL